MGKVVSGLFGGGDSGSEALLAEQARQKKLVEEEAARVKAVEDAARRVRGAGGKRGLLSFAEDDAATKLGG